MKKYRTVWMAILQWGILWTLIIGCSLIWNQHLITERTYAFSRHEAANVIQKDLAFRRWATMHGGVYVHPTKQTPPNPWLTVPKRDVVTTDGDKLTLMNPAYMTRQVMALYNEQFGVKGHITSLMAKNPANAPDPWEADALHQFEKGVPEVRELTTIHGEPYYRLILPMLMEQGCLKCHADTKVPVGGIRGAISASVPLLPHEQAAAASMRGVRLAHAGIWLVGMIGITIASAIYHRQQQRNRQAEDDLRNQEALYASLTTASPTGIFQTDLQGACCYVNERWSQISGLSIEQALGDGWSLALHPDDRQRVCDEWLSCVAEGRAFSLEYRFKLPDGRVNWVYGQSAEIFNEQGVVTGYVGTITDITLLKQTEESLADQSMFLRESQAIAHVGGWKSNPRTDMLVWTEEVYRLLDHPAEQPISHTTCFQYFDHQDRARVQQALEQAQADGIPFRLSCRMISATGRRFWGDFRCIGRLEGPDGSYIAGTLQDITEHKQIEELLTTAKTAAEAANRTKTELLATISHELRTPLNGVMGGVQLLEMTELSEEQDGYLQMVKESAGNELALVNDLLDLAGFEASGMQVESIPFRLLDCIKLAMSLHRSALDERALELVTSLPDELDCMVVGDSRRLAQIISNLLANAIKFTEQGSITLSAQMRLYAGGLRLQLQVADTGIGIAEQDFERIFEPFVQVDMSSTRRFGGTGLGLAICRRLAERMGGSIRVESESGEGSRFILELPLRFADDTQLDTTISDSSPLPFWQGPSRTVLIAEDNDCNLKTAASLVRKLGFKVICAEDGKLALGHWLQGNVDLILMDIQMPVLDGVEATRFIRQREQDRGCHTPIIALTAHAMDGDRERLLAEGFDSYVAKPFRLPDLAAELARLLKP